MTDLLRTLETTEAGSRELEVQFLAALGLDDPTCIERFGRILKPLRSVDDALALVPDGWQWNISNRAPSPHGGRAYINNRELHFVGLGANRPNPAYRGYEDTARTPAIALCIVLVRAHQATNKERHSA